MASNQGMWCSRCGLQLAPWASFCPSCGLQVGYSQGPSDQGGYGPAPSVPWQYQQPSMYQWQASAASAQRFPSPQGGYNQPMPPPLTHYQIQYLMSIGAIVSVPPPLPMPPQPHRLQQPVSIRELHSIDQQDSLQSDFSQQEKAVQGMSQNNEQSLIKPSRFHQQPSQQNYAQQEHPGQHNRAHQVHEQSAQNRTHCQVHQNEQKSYISTPDENHAYNAQAQQSGTQNPSKEQTNQHPTEWQGNAVKLSEPPGQQIHRNGQENIQIEEQIQEPEQQQQQQGQEKTDQEPGSETKHVSRQQEIVVIDEQDQSQQTQQQGLENQQPLDQQNNLVDLVENQKQGPQNHQDIETSNAGSAQQQNLLKVQELDQKKATTSEQQQRIQVEQAGKGKQTESAEDLQIQSRECNENQQQKSQSKDSKEQDPRKDVCQNQDHPICNDQNQDQQQQNLQQRTKHVVQGDQRTQPTQSARPEPNQENNTSKTLVRGDNQLEARDELHTNQQVEMELKELREQLQSSVHRHPEHAGLTSLPKYKPVFGQQANANGQKSFAFEASAKSEGDSSQSKTEKSTNNSKILESDKVSPEGAKEGHISKDEKDVNANRQSHRATHRSSGGSKFASEDANDDRPPIPLPDQKNQKDKNVKLNGEGDNSQEPHQRASITPVVPGEAGDAGHSKKNDKIEVSKEGMHTSESSDLTGDNKEDGASAQSLMEKMNEGADQEPKEKPTDTAKTSKDNKQSTGKSENKTLLELAKGHEASKGTDAKPGSGDRKNNDNKVSKDSGKGAPTSQPELTAYNKKNTPEEDYVSGTKKSKNKAKKNNKGSKQQADDDSKTPYIPPGLRVATGEGVLLHFHTIVSPEFNFKPSKDKAVVVIGGVDFGEWKYHCVELKKEKDLGKGYIQIMGSAAFQISSLKGKKIAYKYQIIKGDQVIWDYIYKPYGTWDHILRIPDHSCVNGVKWHHYDDVIQREVANQDTGVWKKSVASAWSSVTSLFGLGSKSKEGDHEEVSRLVHDRQLAALTYLPKWEGFVMTAAPDKMEAVEAIRLVGKVCDSVMRPDVARIGTYSTSVWQPNGFEGEALLLKFLSERINSFSLGSDIDVTMEGVEKRLISALAISLLIYQYDLRPTKQQWNNLHEGLMIPPNLKKQDYIKLVQNIRETYKSSRQEMVDVIEAICNSSIKHGKLQRLQLTLPLLHFFRQDCKPYEQPEEKDYFNSKWWGVQQLNIDNRFVSRYEKQDAEFDDVLPRLVPLFEVDCLLQRSLLYLHMTPAGLVKFMQTQQASPQVLCCALHILISAHHISHEDIQNLHRCLDLLQPQILKISQSSDISMSTKDCLALVDIVVEITMNMLERAYGSTFHLVTRCCELYAASYSVCTNTLSGKTRASSETLNKLHMQAQKVLSALLGWLYRILPVTLSYDGKSLGFQDEIKVWHLLLSITYSSTEFATTWKTQLLGYLNDRIKKLNNASKVELFSNFDTPDLNPEVSTCLSNAAFAAIDSLVNETKGKGMWDRIFSSSSAKYGYLLSKVLLKSWPKHEDEDSILQHLLTWAPFVNFFKITADEKTGYGTILTEEAQIKLASAKSVFEGICDNVMDGSIIIKQLELIVRDACCNQFVTLCSMIATMNAGKKGKEHDRTKGIITLIAARRKELQAIHEQYKLNECLVKMCRKIDPVDYRQVEQNLRVDVRQLQLCKVCTAATLQNMPRGKVHKPDVHFFQHQPCIMEILQPLYEINESRVFGKLWRRQAAKLRRSGQSHMFSLSDVATKVWHPVYDDQLKEISTKLSNALISLGDIDIHFKELIDNKTVLEQELKTIMSLEDDVDRETLEERLGQIKDYYQYKQQSAVAGEMLKVKDAFGLKGDFTPMETLCKVNSEEAKRHPLLSINKDVDYAAKEMKTVDKDQIRCLKELAKCQDLINWIRKEIKDERELRVFVELAMNSAGETAMEVDRVTCFHRAATGYASFIFDLKETAGYKDLLKVSQKVWKALEKDKDLPTQLIDTQKELHWLRQVRESQGDVETSSLIQAEAINKWGVYIIGRLKPEKGSGEAPVLQLTVTAPEDDKEGTNSGNQSKNRVRKYHLDELKDLQSKLTLVAGKTRDQREEQNEVGYFVEVFTAAQQLAETYEKLRQAGNILFSEWKAYLNCGYQEGASVHIDFGGGKTNLLTGTNLLLTELRFLREFMKKCLEEWYQYVDDRRSDCYHLNYFTTEQLVLLRRCLAQFASTEEDLPPQVFVLLSAVNESCTKDDIRSALKAAAKDIIKQSTDGEVMDEEVNAVETAKKREKAIEIVQQLSDEYGFEEKVAWAAIQDIGLHESDDVYMDWCVGHVQDDDEIDRLFSDLRISEPYLFEEEEPMVDEHEDEDFKKFPSMTKTLHDVTHNLLSQITSKRKTLEKQMTQLWNEHLHSMKNFDVEDCLSLEHLGLILQHLSETNPEHSSRCLPSSLKEGVPNLIVRSSGDVLMTVLSLYMYESGSLPTFEEVLVCSPQTSLEEIVLLWRRAIGDQLGRIFCLVRADLLNYDISVKAEQELAKLMKGQSGYRLVVVCSTEREDSSHIVTALDQYRREMPASRSKESIQEYLQEQFRMQADDIAADEDIDTAASITYHGCNVEVIVSSRPGVGKTLKVQRYTQELMDVLGDEDNTDLCVTVPLQEAVVNQDAIVSALLPHQDESHSSLPVIYHLDVAPMVREGLDPLLFNLLILGGLCDHHGNVWRCKPQDLYVVEMTDFALQQRNKMASRSHQSGPFYAVLPCITCHSPQEILTACQWEQEHDILPQGWHDGDPKVDDQEFSGSSFQRTFQYLVRHSRRTDLDTFEFDDEIEGDDKTFLTTLLSHCGVEDPSWAELSHFAQFLSIQLDDCQNSVFCNPAFHDIESGLKGFKTFVVRFMIKMAMDFATPSLNMSEESPSRAAGSRNIEEVMDEEEMPQELEAFQLRRRWETSLHPYIFFNHDRVSMTFMGFYIDRHCSLRDPNTQEIIEPNIMSPQLRDGLRANRVELSKNFDHLPRWKKLQQLGMVLGVEYVVDPDETYELTTDNVKKMLAIHMRFRCGIPVVIMGETGCGKTRLIRFLCHLQGGLDCDELNNMILMKVHGGTTSNDIRKKITRAQEIAKQNKEKYHVDTVLFFDEANTTEAIGLIKEIMCDGRANGQHIDMADGTLKIVAACNPYRRHTPAMIERLKAAGLGYHVAAEDTQERLGEIPLRELVYRVQALPPSMLPLVWDFGQLNAEVEAKYIRQIVQRYVNTERLMATPNQAQIITDVLSVSQQFMRDQENECSFVSLRDVERCLEVLVWFHDHLDGMLRPLLDAKAEQAIAEESEEEDEDDQYFDIEEYEKLDDLTTSLVLAIGVCYHACLQESRHDYRETVADAFDDPCEVPGGAGQILEEITRCQDIFLDQVNLDANIARNSALKENVFMMVVCIELRIPLFLVGKPGSSKSLAKTIVADAMQGESARSSELFKHLKQVHMTSFQCSPLSTPEGIVGTFRQCSKFQEGKDLDKFVSVVVLDEVGLAEDSPRMPLKTLHPLLETGSEEDEEEPDPYKKVAFIGLSNWALDPAKMNRGILVSREEPDLEELVETAKGICSTDRNVLELIEPLITSLAKAYLAIYEDQARKYFGLRDYYSLIKMVYQFAKTSTYAPSWAEIVHSVRRNFGGLPNAMDPVTEFKKQPFLSTMSNMEPMSRDPDCSPAGLLRASLDRDTSGHGESRYLLILTENYAALPILQQQLLHQQDAITIFGSSFPYDQEYTQVCRNINRIKICMETGRTVVLLNLENLYESLYDALNQYYVYFGGQRYVDLGLGTHRVKCRVHKDFRLIVIADKDVVYKRFPTPLINRLEKHFLATSTMLSKTQLELLEDLKKWVEDFASINNLHQHQNRHTFQASDAFVGYHGDTLASLVFRVCNEIDVHEGDQEWRNLVCDKVKALLLQCATPDSVMRLGESRLLAKDVEQIQNDYFRQDRTSLVSYLEQQLHHRVQDEGTTQDVMAHVTTHSRLLGSRDCTQLQNTLHIPVIPIFLQNFHTEQQFCSEIRDFYTKCKEHAGLLLVQCDDGHINNQLIACASYCVQDEKTQAKEDASKSGTNHLKPAHVVFIIQLATEGKGFTGFRGTGAWTSFHIDDLQPAQPNRPEISHLRGLGIKNLFQRDPDLANALRTNHDEPMETETIAEPTEDMDEMDVEENMAEDQGSEELSPVAQKAKTPISHRQRDSKDLNYEEQAMSGLAPMTEDLSASEDGPAVIDVTRLLQDSIHSAASRISDSERRAERTTERITLLMQLFSSEQTGNQDGDTVQHSGVQSFLLVIKKRFFQLICEREHERGGLADSWLTTEALRVDDVQKSGTFRKAIWHRLISIVSPLLAELIAYCDCNDNLNLLLEHGEGHWQNQLWLAILADPKVSPIRYEDILSPVHNVLRERALVRVLGSSDKPVTAKLPFSWLLKEFIETVHAQALDLRAINDNSSLGRVFQKLVIESPWHELFNQQIPVEVQEMFIQMYLMDFIRMTYKTNFEKENVESELECVYQALEITTQLTRRQLETLPGSNKLVQLLVAVHMSYAQIQSRLSHFARLVELYPKLLDDSNVQQLKRQDGQMVLDATAIRLTIDSLAPESRCWKDSHYQQRWFSRVEAAKPIIESIIQTVIHGPKDVYGEATLGIVSEARDMWEKICVLRLFLEHICPPNLEVEEVLSNQALLLWKTLRNNKNGMKTLEGIKAVENVLKVCCTKASKKHFKMGVDDCPLCQKADITQPVELPCGKICCKECLLKWFRNSNGRGCPACKKHIPEDYALEVTTENREAIWKYSAFRQRCNAFFMDVVSQLCFANGTPPTCEVVERLMTYVTKETEMKDKKMMQTKRLTAFQGDGIDPSPVIRSVLLQLLLQSNLTEVQKYISQYLEQAQHVLAKHKPQDIIEVCMLFVHCLEDSFHRQAAKHDNPCLGLIEMATDKLRAAKTWLERKAPDDDVTVEYLIAIAGARFGLVATAQFLHDVYCQNDEEQELFHSIREVDRLLDEAWELCGSESNNEAHLFLVRHLCHCYGTNTMEVISQYRTLEWVTPQELISQNEECPDRFVVCGGAYCSIREAMAQAVVTGQFTAITKALKGCSQQPATQREMAVLLCLFREVTMPYGAREDQQANQEIIQKLKGFIQKNTSVQQKEFAESLIENHYRSDACNQLAIATGQNIFNQSLVAMIMHAIITFQCAQQQPAIGPLVNLLQNANQMQNSFLPTMPEDNRMEAKKAIDKAAKTGETYAWYECPNGHLYTIGDCGRPYEQSQCKECGANIGGLGHELTQGNKKAEMTDTTMHGHVLGEARGRTAKPMAERHLSPIAVAILRVLMHSVMMGAAVTHPQDVQELIDRQPEAVGEFLWQHIQADMHLMAASCGKSLDDCLFIVHLVLHRIATKNPRNQGAFDNVLISKKSRAAWEAAFAKAYIAPIVEKLEDKLAAANQTLNSDKRFSTNPLMHLLYQQQPTSTVTQQDMCKLHTFPDVWQYRPQVTIESLRQYLERQQNVQDDDGENSFALLHKFLEKDHILSVLQHLPDIIRLQQVLIDRFHRRIDAAEATKMLIQDFLGKTAQDVQQLVQIFIKVWNQVRENIPNYGGIVVPHELCSQVLDTSHSIAMLLPTRRGAGVCSTALVDFLIGTHNEMIEFYHSVSERSARCDSIQPTDATLNHLVAYDKDKDLLPLVLSHRDYAMEAGQGTTHTFNLLALQRQIEDRFLRGRPKVVHKIEQLVFRQDSHDAAVFQTLRNRIPQRSLTPAIQHQILTQLKSLPDLSDCLAVLVIAIGFLVSSPSQPDMHISKYLHTTLSLPPDRGIQASTKAHEYCRLQHILSLWQTLAVEQARRNNQDPFDDIGQEYRVELESDQRANLKQALRHINVEQLIAELYEYIILHLKRTSNQEQDITIWPIADVLEAYMEKKNDSATNDESVDTIAAEIHGLEHFPKDLQFQHAVNTWKTIVKFTSKQ